MQDSYVYPTTAHQQALRPRFEWLNEWMNDFISNIKVHRNKHKTLHITIIHQFKQFYAPQWVSYTKIMQHCSEIYESI